MGQSLHANVTLYNTLPQNNSIPTSDDWAFQGIPIGFWPGCYVISGGYHGGVEGLASAVVLQGDYTMANISSAANTNMYGLLCDELLYIDSIIFQPSSSQANIHIGT